MDGCALSLAEASVAPPDNSLAADFLLNDFIVIRNARTHNLKNLSCDIPHGKLTVISGVSGSGKSSLAFDTIYAEGQRRYVESLSAYARQFLERIEKPDADEIDGLAPAIAIKQKNTTRNPRSTVATATEIYDYLRLLYARCGEVHCIYCDGLVKRNSVDEAAEGVLALGEGTRLNVLFPAMSAAPAPGTEANQEKTAGHAAKKTAKSKTSGKGSESAHIEVMKARLGDLRSSGFNRLWQQGRIFEFSTPESEFQMSVKAAEWQSRRIGRSSKQLDDDHFKKKILDFLVRRGFAFDTALSATRQILSK